MMVFTLTSPVFLFFFLTKPLGSLQGYPSPLPLSLNKPFTLQNFLPAFYIALAFIAPGTDVLNTCRACSRGAFKTQPTFFPDSFKTHLPFCFSNAVKKAVLVCMQGAQGHISLVGATPLQNASCVLQHANSFQNSSCRQNVSCVLLFLPLADPHSSITCHATIYLNITIFSPFIN
ncbi:uncharacterized protein DS421_2g50570 [Arachis hypogaea]|nr:uncharacterized protein DS421_2g50570 [Arachis hypogaea]